MSYDDNGTPPPPSQLYAVPDTDPYLDQLATTPSSDLPPQDIHAEQAVLGALLTQPDILPTIRTHLEPADFWRPAHETIYQTLLTLADQQQPIDPLTVNDALTEAGEIRRIGGAPYLHDLIQACPVVAHADHYARIVLDRSKRRTIQTTATRMLDAVRRGDPDDIDQVYDRAFTALDEAYNRFGNSHTTTSSWTPLDLAAVLNGEEVDPPPVLLARDDNHHLLYAGAVHTLSGEPGSGKTWIALIAALQQLAAGHQVTMIDFEDRASRVIGRLLALGAHPTAVNERFHYIRPHNALDPTTRNDLDRACTGSTLVILDGVTEAMTLHGLELEKNADIARFYDLLPRHIADTTGAAVVLIDHVVKDTEKQGRWALGGQHKLAGIDGVAYIVKAIEPFGRGKTGIARVIVAKDRPGYIEEIALGRTVAELHLDARDVNCLLHTLKPPTEAPKDEAGNMRPTHLMERVSRYIEITPGLGKNDLLDGRISGKKEYLRRAIDRLTQEGYIEVVPGANRKQEHRSITPFREDDEEALA